MNSLWIIISHTYISKLKTKSFIVTTVLTILLTVGLINLQQILSLFSKDDLVAQIAVVDQSDVLFPSFQQLMEANADAIHIQEFRGEEKAAIQAVKDGEFNGLLILSLNEEQLPEAIYKAMTLSNRSLSSSLQNSLQQLKLQFVAKQMNVTETEIAKLYEPISFVEVPLEENAKSEEELNEARGLVYILLFVIYMAVIMYANMIAMEVATEKSSRVMEILISSVSPIFLMFGKIIGIGLLSLTQLLLLLAVGYGSLKSKMEYEQGDLFNFLGFSHIPLSTILYAVIFFLLGYFLYATLAAFLGSVVSRMEDIQQMITPMTFVVIAGFLLAMFGLANPESSFLKFASYIPFFTPMLMFMRVGMLSLPIWEPMLGIVLLLISIVILAIFGARVYKGGVLMYGASQSWKDIRKALQLTKKA